MDHSTHPGTCHRSLSQFLGEGDKLVSVFGGGILSADEYAQISLGGAEIGEFGLYAAEQVESLLIQRLARWVYVALQVRSHARTDYLEHGAARS